MLLRVRGLRKSFGAVAALRHADLDIREGEVVALLGDNGAGKSTFVRLLSGAGRPDAGTFLFGGTAVPLNRYTVRKARDMGIETVHQDRCLCEGQSLWRNMFVGRHLRTRFGFIDINAEREATRVMLGEWLGLGGAGLDPDADVRVLSGGERQALAIGRAMYFGARLVILDEPTTALSSRKSVGCWRSSAPCGNGGVPCCWCPTMCIRRTTWRTGSCSWTREGPSERSGAGTPARRT